MIRRFGIADPQKVENGPAQIQSTAAEECGPSCEDLVPFLHTFPHLEIWRTSATTGTSKALKDRCSTQVGR